MGLEGYIGENKGFKAKMLHLLICQRLYGVDKYSDLKFNVEINSLENICM